VYLTNLYLERFGERSDLRVEGLAEGLNLVFAPSESGKTTVVQFLQTIFGGFDVAMRERYATRGWGGMVSLQVGQANYSISRYDDGGRNDRLTVERPDDAVVERRHVHRLLSDLNHALLRQAVVVDFNHRAELGDLLRQIASCGFLPTVAPQVTDKNVRDGNLVEGEQHVSLLRREIANIERTLSELGQSRKKLQAQLKTAAHPPVRFDSLPTDVKVVERQLRRWKRTLRDLLQYKKLAAEKFAARNLSDVKQALYCDALVERDQFARCESELRRVIRWLHWRRRSLLDQRPADGSTGPGHRENLAATFTDQPTKRAITQELDSLGREVARLAEVRLKWLAEIDEWELDMAERQTKDHPVGDSWTPIVRDASEFLRRMTGNDDVRVQVSDKFDAWIENQAGVKTRYDQLDRGMRDQLYLAFCLAVATANQRWGRQVPLVLNGVFTHFPSQNVRRALEFLMEFSRGQQVICFTRHEHVVSVARLLNVPVRSLSSVESSTAVKSSRQANWASPSPSTVATTERTRSGAPDAGSMIWAADELSQRFGFGSHRATTDLIDAANTLEGVTCDLVGSAASADTLTIGDKSYCLGEHDPIEKTPSLDPTNAQRLRKIGLLRVGDLLRVPTADVAHDLRHTGVSVDMIESWRSQARLMCRVPGLRTYDARILVACGIRDPEQLIQMQAGALRARVKEFASSAEGQAILMSGTEFELSRVTDWINSARELRRTATTSTTAAAQPKVSQRREHRRRERRNGSRPTVDAVLQTLSANANPAQRSYDLAVHPHYIRLTDSVAAIPWVGTAAVKRLQKCGITTVAIFLDTPADVVAERLRLSRIRLETIQRWQAQLKLVCVIPHLRFQDARLLYSLGISTSEVLAASSPADLGQRMASFCQSPKGRRLLGNSRVAEQEQIAGWITAARQYHPQRAA
jgi:hypothetical protein